MRIEFIREFEAEIFTDVGDWDFVIEVTSWKFEPGQAVKVRPCDADCNPPGKTAFWFWKDGCGEIPNNAFRRVPAFVTESGVRIGMNANQNRGYTPRELARILRVSPDKVSVLIKSGKLPAINMAMNQCGKPRFVILPEHLAEFERLRKVGPPAKPGPRQKPRQYGVDYYPEGGPNSQART
jgi:hypothetical protein